MKIKIFIILILIFGVCAVLKLHNKTINTEVPDALEEPKEITVEPFNIAVPDSLKTNFKRGTDYCKTQNIAQSGAFEICVLYYIYERNSADHEIILKINTYCAKNTTNECDRRNCVESYMK